MAPFNPFFADVDRMFEEMTRGLGGASAPSFGTVDAMLDTDSGVLTAHLDLPGVDRESLVVRVVGDALVVEASRNRAGTAGRVLASERAAGRVRRVVRTGRPLDPDDVTASYEDGVLTVVASTRVPGREIGVQFAGGQRSVESASSSSGEQTAVEGSRQDA